VDQIILDPEPKRLLLLEPELEPKASDAWTWNQSRSPTVLVTRQHVRSESITGIFNFSYASISIYVQNFGFLYIFYILALCVTINRQVKWQGGEIDGLYRRILSRFAMKRFVAPCDKKLIPN